MNSNPLEALLTKLKNSDCSIEEMARQIRAFSAEDLTDACIDHDRQQRTGIPEVIYGASKTTQQIIRIADSLLEKGGPVIATRVNRNKAEKITRALPQLSYHAAGHIVAGNSAEINPEQYRGTTLVVSAGTSDKKVAEEARITLETLGHPVNKIYDVGVAGLHRLLGHRKRLSDAATIIVVAGMEGALPSVVAGLVTAPVIAVPTSVGYGASFGGIAALLGMLNSCAPGVAVVNIDNGFGAACMAESINRVHPPS